MENRLYQGMNFFILVSILRNELNSEYLRLPVMEM